ncbi:unnamed protein product [Acanthoscelides obtectus]|uniref:Chitin-binding type-2 domain-containing protein n=1 Tax=Acanthoscelides obtectus TaxID=200917 RepID=A0A9P0LET1_ACAOB|nr:unnamed protein product [Acanthoscelides obtectus]CAK1635964.1 Protein obstructor-E [Acanthoscelides obtectus]
MKATVALFVALAVVVVQVCCQRYRPQQQFNNYQPQQKFNNYQPDYHTNLVRDIPQVPYSGVSCPERDGRFPTRTCDGYIECKDGVGEEKTCPDGLLFNPATGKNAYPCQYPLDVDCTGREQTQPAQSTPECPHQFGYYRLGGPQECGQFKNCVDGKAFIFDCPEGLAFNEETLRCDWPDQVASCDSEAYLGFTCPQDAKDYGLGQEEYRYFRSPSDCQHYYICINSRPRLYGCGEGKAFNELINACDGAENVTGCALPYRAESYQGQPNRAESYKARPYRAETYKAQPYKAEPQYEQDQGITAPFQGIKAQRQYNQGSRAQEDYDQGFRGFSKYSGFSG